MSNYSLSICIPSKRNLEDSKESISSAILTCTGSEANDLALRMGEVMSGKTGLIATDHTYHGNTATVSQLSMTNSPRIGNKDNIRYVPAPDSYRPLGGKAGMDHGHAFAAEVKKMIEELETSGHGFSAIIICAFFSNEGFLQPKKLNHQSQLFLQFLLNSQHNPNYLNYNQNFLNLSYLDL